MEEEKSALHHQTTFYFIAIKTIQRVVVKTIEDYYKTHIIAKEVGMPNEEEQSDVIRVYKDTLICMKIT